MSENKDMAPFIRTCLSGGVEAKELMNTGFHVWFLGTGGSLPSKARMTTATMLQLGGQTFLFDAGEGTQRQLLFTRQHFTNLKKIFITHMHADHVLGLPGIVLMAQLAGRDRGSAHEIEIYGPPGIYNYIASIFALTNSGISGVKVIIHELVGGDADNNLRRRLGKENMIHGHFPYLLNNKALVREAIERNEDGTWTIQIAQKPDLVSAHDVDRGGDRPVNITAAEVKHLDNIQTFGYVVSEPEPSQKIDAKKATELGVAPGRKYRKLKNGSSVMSDDGIREVRPEQVLIGANRKIRKFALVGDNCGMTPAMEELCMNADVLVHEAIFSIENRKVSSSVVHAAL